MKTADLQPLSLLATATFKWYAILKYAKSRTDSYIMVRASISAKIEYT